MNKEESIRFMIDFAIFMVAVVVLIHVVRWIISKLQKKKGLMLFYVINDLSFVTFTISGFWLIGIIIIEPTRPIAEFAKVGSAFLITMFLLPLVTFMDFKRDQYERQNNK